MALRNIVQDGDPILKKKCRPVTKFDDRLAELLEKGKQTDYATVLADIEQRDYQDTHRAVAPLRQAEDAILVDTSDIGIEESFALLKKTILGHI